ncbi:hypothetical protein OMW55_10875 [Sphingomonas sp. BN140010]|uniref:Uncharacterized protein n=1 Tax=Sphingomonas arvum TaxID=2992113 RepID=A0ABT3JGV9_9SPHN|nr:hypothetical protein [Sphingomonas sp. BN140010]MCW3798305.1 hypothetical protein [Sphingomonas sp. BN140010]
MTDDIAYHRNRASRELNLGLACGSLAAARAHLRLSSLHFQKARDLESPRQAERPPFVL